MSREDEFEVKIINDVNDSSKNIGMTIHFFFLHFKESNSAGEDGDFDKKIAEIEFFDSQIGKIAEMNPDVLVVTGDHSTPSKLHQHSNAGL